MKYEASGNVASSLYDQNSRPVRIVQAFGREPISSELRDGPVWNQSYARNLETVKEFGTTYDVCDHGYEHLMHISKNVDMLRQVVLQSAQDETSLLDENADWESDLDLSSLLFVVLKSDIYYGDPSLSVENRSVIDHAKKSGEDMERYRLMESFPTMGAQLIHDNVDWFKDAVTLDLSGAIAQTDTLLRCRQHPPRLPKIKPRDVSVLLPKVGDTLDLLRASRVRHINPAQNRHNLYYRLASQVRAYSLIASEKSLDYCVELGYPNESEPDSGHRFHERFNKWWEEAQQSDPYDRNYADVWRLLKNFAAVLGKEFRVRPAQPSLREEINERSLYVIHR